MYKPVREKLRVCYIYKTTFPGVLSEINFVSTYLAKKGLSINIIALGGEKTFKTKENHIDNLEIYRISLGKNNNSSLKFILKSIKIINKKNFDLVHVFHFRWVILLPLLCLKKNTKWLLDIRSGNLKDDFRRPLANLITRLESRFFDKVAVIHEELRKIIFGNSQNNSIKYPIFPIGVDLGRFKKERRGQEKYFFASEDYVICYLGHLYIERRLHHLIETIYISKKEIPNLKLLFIGDGDDINRLKNIAQKLFLAKDVVFTGFIKYEEIPKYLNFTDIAVSYVPITKGYDSQPPIKTIEYLATEMPVIATNTQGNRYFIKNNQNGLLVGDDPESLAGAIIRLAKNPELREKLIKNTRKSVEKYDWQNIIEEKILPVYRNLRKDKSGI